MNKRRLETGWSGTFIVLAAVFLLTTAVAHAADITVVKAKKIYTATRGVIENGMILIEKGKITGVGQSLPLPAGATVLEADIVTPGLIDIHSHVGVYSSPTVSENEDGNEMTNPLTPQVRALDSFHFEDPAIAAGRAGGVTTVVALPGSGNVIGGMGVAVKLKNAPPQQMVLEEVCVLKMAIEGNPVGVYGARKQMPSTLMAVYHLARKAFIEAREYQKKWEAYEKKVKKKKEATPPKRDLGKEHLVLALQRKIPVHIHCATASEIMSCLRLADEFNLRLSLAHCYWAYLVLDDLKGRTDVAFNVGPPMFFGYFDDPQTFKNNPAILANAGLNVSLQTDAIGGGQQNLLHLASLCVRYGMKEADALRAITIREAEAAGLEKRIGSIEVGKDADLAFFDGEPFALTTRVAGVMIDGKMEYRADLEAKPALEIPLPQIAGELTLPDAWPDGGDTFALRGGTILTMAGPPIVNGVILVKKGKIDQIGAAISVPEGMPVIDAGSFLVMPGLVAPRSHVGITANWRRQSSIDENSAAVVPELEVKHAVEPQSPLFSLIRETGVATVQVTPGNANAIGGRGLVLKTVGSVVDRMVIKDRSAVMFGLGTSAKRKEQLPSTRMGLAALLRETLIKARDYRQKWDKYEKDKKGEAPDRDLSLEALVPVLRGETPALVHAERLDDIMTALRIADEFGLRVILDGATDAYKVIPELQKRKIPVILEDLFRGLGQVEDRGFNPANAALLSRAGIPVAFRPAEGSWYTPGSGEAGGELLTIAAFSFAHGMGEEAALRAVTIDAARILGVEQRVGSLEPGKDADILLLRGHPFATSAVAEALFVDGKLVFRRQKEAHL